MKYPIWLILPALLLLSAFNLPNEEQFLGQKAANIKVFDGRGHLYNLYTLLRSKPLIISPVYTKCPSLCGIISNGVQVAINETGTLGKEFNVATFSFDSSDIPSDLKSYESRWKMDGANWKTISASAKNIRMLMSSIGYEYEYDTATKEFNHPAVLIVLTPSGRISRYIYGVNPSKRDIRLAVLEAASEKTKPGIFNGFYLRCFGYDPVSKTYKADWGFIISTSAGLLMIGLMSSIFIKSFIVSKK
jgi:protein SCO1/2